MLPSFLTTAAIIIRGVGVQANNFSELRWFSEDPTLPKVVIYSTGGTIHSASNYSRLDNINYGLGQGPTPAELIGNVSEVLNVAQLGVLTLPAPGGSAGINSSLYLNLTQYANKHLCSPGSDIVGAIMFHGTNTLEETAFGVDLTFNCSKPFIATGAMRPDTYVSPDGRSNFFQAVAAASSPSLRNRGGLVVFNDRITSIFYSTKLNANTPDTFKALEQGNLGVFLGGQPFYFFDPALPTGRPYFDVRNASVMPSVIILYGHQGFNASLMYAAVTNGAKGLVLLGPGAAAISPSAQAAIIDLYSKGVPTSYYSTSYRLRDAKRFPRSSFQTPANDIDSIKSSYVGPDQSRIMLQLALEAGYTLDQIRDLFELPLLKAIYGPAVSQAWYYGASRLEDAYR